MQDGSRHPFHPTDPYVNRTGTCVRPWPAVIERAGTTDACDFTLKTPTIRRVPMQLTGIHHLTAISAAIKENHRFYTQTLGMRLVKRSVNQDDVSAYHLFYADAVGHPGTDLTFFDWPVPRERRGTNSVVRTMLRVSGLETIEWWKSR